LKWIFICSLVCFYRQIVIFFLLAKWGGWVTSDFEYTCKHPDQWDVTWKYKSEKMFNQIFAPIINYMFALNSLWLTFILNYLTYTVFLWSKYPNSSGKEIVWFSKWSRCTLPIFKLFHLVCPVINWKFHY